MGCVNSERFRSYFLICSFAISIILIISLLATTHNGDILAWSEFWTRTFSGTMVYSIGYRVITECWYPDDSTISLSTQCFTQSIEQYDRALNGVCHKGGIGIISSYTFILLFTLMNSILILSGKFHSNKYLNNANLTSLLSILSLAISIIPVGLWYADCQSKLSGASASYGSDPARYPIRDIQAGAGIGLSATIIVAFTIISIVSIWRSIVGTIDESAGILHSEQLIDSTNFEKFHHSTSSKSISSYSSSTNNWNPNHSNVIITFRQEN